MADTRILTLVPLHNNLGHAFPPDLFLKALWDHELVPAAFGSLYVNDLPKLAGPTARGVGTDEDGKVYGDDLLLTEAVGVGLQGLSTLGYHLCIEFEQEAVAFWLPDADHENLDMLRHTLGEDAEVVPLAWVGWPTEELDRLGYSYTTFGPGRTLVAQGWEGPAYQAGALVIVHAN